MSCQLPVDCLNEIFEYLKDDKFTLHSCLLVNHTWCEVSVRILWQNIWKWNIKKYSNQQNWSLRIATSIFNTLISCLPNESKELLHKNEIFISTPTSRPPLFNYAAFCKVLSINEISQIVGNIILENESSNKSSKKCLIINEIIKMFMNQISSLKSLSYHHGNYHTIIFSLNYFPGVRDLSELICSSNTPSDFFYQLSQICYNLQSIFIALYEDASYELRELISSQNNLKSLVLTSYHHNSWTSIIPSLKKHSITLTKLHLYINNNFVNIPLSFVSLFTHLQEFILSFHGISYAEDFKNLQYTKFPNLQTLRIPYQCRTEYVIKFLETNGKNLLEFYTDGCVNSLSITNYCPNLRNLCAIIGNGLKVDILKNIFISCQYLESIIIWWGKNLSNKEVLETVVKYSPNNFCKLVLYNNSDTTPEDLELFFINWKNRMPFKLLTIIAIRDYYGINSLTNEKNMVIIKKYETLGVIKFRIKENQELREEIIYPYDTFVN
jgi:hypothetical protein